MRTGILLSHSGRSWGQKADRKGMGADQIWVKCLHCHMTVALGEIFKPPSSRLLPPEGATLGMVEFVLHRWSAASSYLPE